jgi:hypothetical protein
MVVSPEVAEAIEQDPGAVRVVVKTKDGSTLVCGAGLRQTTPMICRDAVDLTSGPVGRSDLVFRFMWASHDHLLRWAEAGLFGAAADYCERSIAFHTGQVKYFTDKLAGLNHMLTQFTEEEFAKAAKGMKLDRMQKEFRPIKRR